MVDLYQSNLFPQILECYSSRLVLRLHVQRPRGFNLPREKRNGQNINSPNFGYLPRIHFVHQLQGFLSCQFHNVFLLHEINHGCECDYRKCGVPDLSKLRVYQSDYRLHDGYLCRNELP